MLLSFRKEKWVWLVLLLLLLLLLFFFNLFIYFNWKLVTLQYCSGLCHTLTWISHGCTCVPHPEAPSHFLLIPFLTVIPVHQPWAPVSCIEPGLAICLWRYFEDAVEVCNWLTLVREMTLKNLGGPEQWTKRPPRQSWNFPSKRSISFCEFHLWSCNPGSCPMDCRLAFRAPIIEGNSSYTQRHR